ncbi:MAG: DUF3556 domain-containing protein [Chloroflexota bacterium]
MLERFVAPKSLPYDYNDWKKASYPNRIKIVCQAWIEQGFGAPLVVSIFYFVKVLLYIWGGLYFASFSAELGPMREFGSWWWNLEALKKLILWTSLIEVLGLGGSSGPLTGRYLPPFGASLYFLRPNTLKASFFPGAPLVGGDKRTIVEVGLYILLLGLFMRGLIAPAVTVNLVLPIVILLPLLGVLDKTVFLAARSDVYYPMMLTFLFPEQTGNGLIVVWFAIWFWAAFSKLTPVFPTVVTVMLTNSPVLTPAIFSGFKRMLVKDFPEDCHPSKIGIWIAHFGTMVEFAIPILLLVLSNRPSLALILLVIISTFHLFIFLNFPLGVPLEWNVVMVFGAWLLFYAHPEWSFFNLAEPVLIAMLTFLLLVIPIAGHLFPRYVSFLMSMRYYAGTWPYSVWLFKGNAKEKIDQYITKTSPAIEKQLESLYSPELIEAMMTRVIGFRMLHLPSRALHDLIPMATDNNVQDYLWVEGEFMAGELIGWNFGDGHLHNEALLKAVQRRCHFASGELRVIMVESQQLHNGNMAWRIHDAKDGLLQQGTANLHDLKHREVWPTE